MGTGIEEATMPLAIILFKDRYYIVKVIRFIIKVRELSLGYGGQMARNTASRRRGRVPVRSNIRSCNVEPAVPEMSGERSRWCVDCSWSVDGCRGARLAMGGLNQFAGRAR